MKVTICGSMHHIERMKRAEELLTTAGYEVETPNHPDLGVLVQQEYGSSLKDPFPHFTNGKVTRLQLVETAVFNVAVQTLEANA